MRLRIKMFQYGVSTRPWGYSSEDIVKAGANIQGYYNQIIRGYPNLRYNKIEGTDYYRSRKNLSSQYLRWDNKNLLLDANGNLVTDGWI